MNPERENPGWFDFAHAMVILFLAVLIRTAWLCDDAYITLRSVWNFVHGYGLTWNTAERVQAYTHPLWMMALSSAYFFTREHYYTTVFLSVALSLAAVVTATFVRSPSFRTSAIAVILCCLSRAFVDFSTSGLENPLTHLLLAVFFVMLFTCEANRRTLFLLSFVAALATLNRMDAILFFVPGLGVFAWRLRRDVRALALAAAAWIPFLAWEIFSLIYYGFPFPNPAYSKLGHGWPAGELIRQGGLYFYVSLWKDPITPAVIVLGCMLGLLERKPVRIAAVVGVMLYLLYVLKIGGDFMSGRFFSAAYLVSVVLLFRSEFFQRRIFSFGVAMGAVIAAFIVPHPTLLSGADYRVEELAFATSEGFHVSEERGFYYRDTGLLRVLTGKGSKAGSAWAQVGKNAAQAGLPMVSTFTIGFCGFAAGPNVHVLDFVALSDPLLARLPASRAGRLWVGHFGRRVPDGYIQTLLYSTNTITDPALADYFDQIKLIARGPLFTRERWRAIVRVNLRPPPVPSNLSVYLEQKDVYTQLPLYHSRIGESGEGGKSVTYSLPLSIPSDSKGVRVYLDELTRAETIGLNAKASAPYEIKFMAGEKVLAELEVSKESIADGRAEISVPPAVRDVGFDVLWISSPEIKGGALRRVEVHE